MKKLLFSSFTALMMLFSMFGHVRAQETSETTPTETPQISMMLLNVMGEGEELNSETAVECPRYIAVMGMFTLAEEYQEHEIISADIYYTFEDDVTLSAENFEQAGGKILKTEYTGETYLFTNTDLDNPTLRVLASFTVKDADGNEITLRSEEESFLVSFIDVDAPVFSVPTGTEVNVGDVITITNTLTDGFTVYSTSEVLPTYMNQGEAGAFPYDDEGIEITGNPGETVTIKAINYKENDVIGDGSKITTVTYKIHKPQVTVALSANTWSEGEDAPKVSVTPEDDIEIGALADGKVAVKVDLFKMNAYPEETAVQYITATGETALETDDLTAGVWNLSYTLVKNDEDGKEVVFDGAEINATENDMMLTVGGAENNLVLSVQFMPAQWEIGSEDPLMVTASINNDDNLSFGTDDDNSEIVVLITFTKDSESKQYLLTQSFGEIDPEELGLTEGTWEITYKAGKATSTIENFTELERTVEMAANTTTSIEVIGVEQDPEITLYFVDETFGKNFPMELNIECEENPAYERADFHVYYTTDGSEPSEEAYKAQGAVGGPVKMTGYYQDEDGVWIYPTITLSAYATVKAVATVMVGTDKTIATSMITKEFKAENLQSLAKNPAFSESAQEVAKGTKVKINVEKPADLEPGQDFMVYYTLDGSDPLEERLLNDMSGDLQGVIKSYDYDNEEEITIDSNTTIKAIAYVLWFESGMMKYEGELGYGSDIVEHTYLIAKDIAMPVITPNGGEVKKGDTVRLSAAEGARIYYSINADTVTPNSTLYVAANGIIIDKDTTTVRAIAVKKTEGQSDSVSNIAMAMFTVKKDTVAAPKFSVAAGQVEKGTKVRITCDTAGADIYYTVNGGNPTAASTKYEVEISIDSNMTIKAIAVKAGLVNSAIVTAAYTLKGEDPEPVDTVAAPTFNHQDGDKVKVGDSVVISCVTEGAEIFYALDTASTFVKYESAIKVTKAVTVKAYAKKGEAVSDTVKVALVIDDAANEGKELAGVSVYPNPSDGRFSVSVPVNAVVEVFAANGRMTKRVNVSAGESAMQLDNAGVYFIRVRANGQETVKKVVVR